MSRSTLEGSLPNRPTPSASTLADLFVTLFTAEELRRFLARLDHGEALLRALPGAEVALETFAFEAAGGLLRRGLVDSSLWTALEDERPGKVDAVRVASAPSSPRVQASTPARRRLSGAERRELIVLILNHLPRVRPIEELELAVSTTDIPAPQRVKWSADAQTFVSHLVLHCERHGLDAEGRTGLERLAEVALQLGDWTDDEQSLLARLTEGSG